MKRLFLSCFALLLSLFCFAQDMVVDKEKLLEFYQNQRYAEAARYLQQTYPANTTDVKALLQLAYVNLMAGNLPNAAALYQKIDSLQPRTMSVYFNLANIYAKRGDNLRSRSYLEKIISIDSTNFNALKQLPNYTDSISLKIFYLKKANNIRPADADVAGDLAECYKLKKMPENAYKVLQVAIAADTGNFVLQRQILPFANALKKYQEVTVTGEKLLNNDRDPNVMKDVGTAYFFLKRYEKSLSYFKMIEDLDKQNESILYYMTLCYRELKDNDRAAFYANKTIAEGISPNISFYYSVLGDILETSNKLAKASLAYQKGLTFNADRQLYYRLGLLNDLKLNKKAAALRYYKLYLQNNPDVKTEQSQIDYTKIRVDQLSEKK